MNVFDTRVWAFVVLMNRSKWKQIWHLGGVYDLCVFEFRWSSGACFYAYRHRVNKHHKNVFINLFSFDFSSNRKYLIRVEEVN